MSRSNYDKPFYVDVGTSIVAVRCASNHDVVFQYDHIRLPQMIQLAEDALFIGERINLEDDHKSFAHTSTTKEARATP